MTADCERTFSPVKLISGSILIKRPLKLADVRSVGSQQPTRMTKISILVDSIQSTQLVRMLLGNGIFTALHWINDWVEILQNVFGWEHDTWLHDWNPLTIAGVYMFMQPSFTWANP